MVGVWDIGFARIMSLSDPVPQVSRGTKLCAIGLQRRELLRRNSSAAIGRVLQGLQQLSKCEDAHTIDTERGLDLLHRGTLPVTALLPVERQQDGRGNGACDADQVDGLALGGAIR